MKYADFGIKIPQAKREEYNRRCLAVIDEGVESLSREDIANFYTGIGGLHGLSLSDFDSYAKYSDAKKEFEGGQFFTDFALAQWVVDCVCPDDEDVVADLTCGHGSFINCLPNEKNVIGIELEDNAFRVAEYLYPEANIRHGDIMDWVPREVDIVIGNPPFGLRWNVDDEDQKSEFCYCLRAADALVPGGILAVIVPAAFLGDEYIERGNIKAIDKEFNFVAQFTLDEKLFARLGVTSYPTKLLIMQKKSRFLKNVSYKPGSELPVTTSEEIHEQYLLPLKREKRSVRAKLAVERIQNAASDKEWERCVQKLMFDLRRHPGLKKQYKRCHEYVSKFERQQHLDYKPKKDEKMIERESIIPKLRAALKEQSEPPERHEIRMVKVSGGFKLKAYSRKKHAELKDNKNTFFPIEKVVRMGFIPGDLQAYRHQIRRKTADFELNDRQMRDMAVSGELYDWLENFQLFDRMLFQPVRLNEIQQEDTNILLQRPYGILQWEPGSGKTLCALAQIFYRMYYKKQVENTFVVSSAIAIDWTWTGAMVRYDLPYIRLRKISDIGKIEPGQIVLITVKKLSELAPHLRRYMKSIKQRSFMVFDECHNAGNEDSAVTKSVLHVFRKLRYKLAMTGTLIRNNISDSIKVEELLYNNSYNMVCECEHQYRYAKKDDDTTLNARENPYYMRAYPAYKKGYSLFRTCHLPEKLTVFARLLQTQDIYNAEVLKKFIGRSIISRSFQEVTGRDIIRPSEDVCEMNDAEKALYKTSVDEFNELEYMFNKTGDSRKDAMMKIINQINLMLRICAAGHLFYEYASDELPNKFLRIIDMIRGWNDSMVAIGVRNIEVAHAYTNVMRRVFPNRTVLELIGENTSVRQRQSAIDDILRPSRNGILISTQQCLSESIDVEFVEHCVIPQLHWNSAGMEQYYHRFIRYISEGFRYVHYVTYQESIENNLINLIIAKERLSLFFKGEELDDKTLFAKFGMDPSRHTATMYKEVTDKGVVLRWGKQVIAKSA